MHEFGSLLRAHGYNFTNFGVNPFLCSLNNWFSDDNIRIKINDFILLGFRLREHEGNIASVSAMNDGELVIRVVASNRSPCDGGVVRITGWLRWLTNSGLAPLSII